jgi:hypothetical protein
MYDILENCIVYVIVFLLRGLRTLFNVLNLNQLANSLTPCDFFFRSKAFFFLGHISCSSSSIGTTTLSWVSACSTIVEHSQQEGFTECRCQRHV